jgi:LmeA-like phospholipid-binding
MSATSRSRRRRRRPRWGLITLIAVAALILIALIVDRVAVVYAEDRVATQIQDRGFTSKPHVTITGFPFLTQVVSRRLDKVLISAAGGKLGPVDIKRVNATLTGIRLNSGYSGGTVSQVSGTALIGFAGLAGAAGVPGLTVSAGGPGQVKITADLGPVSGTATAQVTRAGPGKIRIMVTSGGGLPADALGSLRDVTLPLPALPMGMSIRGVSITGEGVLVRIAGQNVSFGS